MDHSRSPRVPLSDEARLLKRLAEPELPPGATDAERAAARAEAAAGVEHAANELGGRCAEAYQELHPDWQPTLTDIEVSNERAAELTSAAYDTRAAMNDPALDSSALRVAHNRIVDAHNDLEELRNSQPTAVAWLQPGMTQQPVTLQQPVTPQPFASQGHRLDE